MFESSDYEQKKDKDYDYHRLILDHVLAQKTAGKTIGDDNCWFAQVGPCIAMVQYIEEGSGCCWDEMKLWPLDSFTSNNVCCRPCFEITWGDDSITVNAYQSGNWEKELLGHIGNSLKHREAEFARYVHEDDY
jgi:hypothetical protein